ASGAVGVRRAVNGGTVRERRARRAISGLFGVRSGLVVDRGGARQKENRRHPYANAASHACSTCTARTNAFRVVRGALSAHYGRGLWSRVAIGGLAIQTRRPPATNRGRPTNCRPTTCWIRQP